MKAEVTPQHRAEVIAGLRAMAQFLEDRPEIPCPQSVRMQHSYVDTYDKVTGKLTHSTDAEKIAFVQAAASQLGIEPRIYDDGTGAVLEYAVAARTTYTVHAKLLDDGTAEAVNA
ncbi:MAG TPA: hypothetical protein VFX60_19205 [Micromonospora sp.]|nr:hypothetical protein [Micromonospora sp.]